MFKLKAVQFTLTRLEGPRRFCDKPETVFSWKEADEVLQFWALSAPDDGTYDKVNFEIVYQDGTTYEGRFDLKHKHWFKSNLLGKHMMDHLNWVAAGKEDDIKPGLSIKAKNFLERYEVGFEKELLKK